MRQVARKTNSSSSRNTFQLVLAKGRKTQLDRTVPLKQRQIFEELFKSLGFKTYEDCYKLTHQSLCSNVGGFSILNFYRGSVLKALQNIFPEYLWVPWSFSFISKNFWSDRVNHRRFFDQLGNSIGILKFSDWYHIDRNQVFLYGGRSLLEIHYNGSIVKALSGVYPEFEWEIWRFKHVNQGYWIDEFNKRRFLDLVGDNFGTSFNDWYSLRNHEVEKYGGSGLLSIYENSISDALSHLYPEYPWQPWKFTKTRQRFWKDPKNCKYFLDWVAQEIGFTSFSDWYKISLSVITNFGGSGILRHHNNSLYKTISSIYTDYDWRSWKFVNTHPGLWDDRKTLHGFISELSEKLEIRRLEDWYRISRVQLRNHGAGGISENRSKLLREILSEMYPDHDWDQRKFSSSNKKSSQWLRWIRLGRPVEFDVFVPELNLVVEYQGQHHYSGHYHFGGVVGHWNRDREKTLICKRLGLTLVEVPFWSGSDENVLKHILFGLRPDLFGCNCL